MGWFLYDNDPRHERVKFASNIKDINREKATSSAYKKYEYGHLRCWYIKSTLYRRFLKGNKIFKKKKKNSYSQNSVLWDRSILYSPFCLNTSF